MPIPATAAQIAAEPGQAGGATEETSAQPAAQDTSPRVIDLGTGSAAPEIELPLFDGETLLLSDLGGKVVVLNFWASWCPPCRWEMPSFEEIWREYKDQDVVFVGIAVSDEEKEARAFAESAGVSYPLGLDAAGEFARAYRVTSLPTTILIDREGNEARKIANVANETVLKLFLKGLIGNGT
jgi:thiol-disulfide isomerase/thioredoxin